MYVWWPRTAGVLVICNYKKTVAFAIFGDTSFGNSDNWLNRYQHWKRSADLEGGSASATSNGRLGNHKYDHKTGKMKVAL
jgi:hypothetical protein